MKKIAFWCVSIITPILTYAVCPDCKPQKIYVHLEDFTFEENGIWLKEPTNRIVKEGVTSIHYDEGGYYIRGYREERVWTCPDCHKKTEGRYSDTLVCKWCGWPPSIEDKYQCPRRLCLKWNKGSNACCAYCNWPND